jgi:adenylylsulfate kinase
MLDGDEIRQRLCKDLGFSKEGRDENIRRIAYVSKLLTRVGGIAIVAAISPYRESRDRARMEIGDFVEVFVDCPLPVCMERDVKGLYLRANRGEIKNFTGISDPYEPPENPEIFLCTDQESQEISLKKILAKLADLHYISGPLVEQLINDKPNPLEEKTTEMALGQPWSV